MRLYLVQHGEAVVKEIDSERPLSTQGRADVARLADRLRSTPMIPARVLHSGKLRAEQTAAILAAALGAPLEVSDGLAPNDSVGVWAERAGNESSDLMLVGHQPFMGSLAALLLTASEDNEVVDFRPGSLLALEWDDASSWRIITMLRPDI